MKARMKMTKGLTIGLREFRKELGSRFFPACNFPTVNIRIYGKTDKDKKSAKKTRCYKNTNKVSSQRILFNFLKEKIGCL